MTGVHVYIAGIALACVVPFGGMTVSALAGANGAVSQGTARPYDTVLIAPARAERVGDGGQGRTNPSEQERKSSLVGEFGNNPATTSALLPVAHDYTGSERVVPAALWSAVVAHFPAEERMHALHVAYCESRYRADVVSAEGARGLFQIVERYHGPVPSDVDGQTAQAAHVFKAHGWEVWDCA